MLTMSCALAKDGNSKGLQPSAPAMDPVQHSEVSRLAVIDDQASHDLRLALQHEQMAPRVIAVTFCSVLAARAGVGGLRHNHGDPETAPERPGTASGVSQGTDHSCTLHNREDEACQPIPHIGLGAGEAHRAFPQRASSSGSSVEKDPLEAGRAILEVMLELEQRQRPASKVQYFKGDSVHRQRLRLWQALCVLVPFAAPEKLDKLLEDIVAALHQFDLASVKQYQERGVWSKWTKHIQLFCCHVVFTKDKLVVMKACYQPVRPTKLA